jgi:2-iminobutanoate/2-iminopropanoate deaminase
MRRITLPFVLVAGAALGYGVARATPAQQGAPLKETVNGITYHMPYGRPTRPFTPAVQTGNLIFVAGQIGTGAQGTVVPGGIEAETRQTLMNIKDILEKSGSGMDRVVKCTAFLADMKEWDAMNTVYTTFFPDHKPARSAFGSTGLALNARVEIECIGVAR